MPAPRPESRTKHLKKGHVAGKIQKIGLGSRVLSSVRETIRLEEGQIAANCKSTSSLGFLGKKRMKRKIPKRLMLILDEAKKALRKIYGSRLRGIVLYGSHARGEAVAGSDIDLLVLLQNMSDPVAELEKLSKRIRQIDFKYDTLISIVPMDAKEYETRKLPLILNARREGVAV